MIPERSFTRATILERLRETLNRQEPIVACGRREPESLRSAPRSPASTSSW